MEPKPTARACSFCGSYQMVEHVRDDGPQQKTLYLQCNMCRRTLDILTASPLTIKVFKRKRRLASKNLRRS